MFRNRLTRRLILLTVLLALAVAGPIAQRTTQPAQQAPATSAAQLLQTAINRQTVDGKLDEAIAIYQRIVTTYPHERTVVATALVRMAQCHEQLGNRNAQALYERVVREFGDQLDAAAQAKARLAQIGHDGGKANAMGPVIRQIWSETPAFDLNDISPDGRFLSGTDYETGDVVVLDLATRAIRRLTDIPKDRRGRDLAEFGVWSHDGRWLAYVWYSAPSEKVLQTDLRLVDTLAGAVRTIAIKRAEKFGRPFDWSPDGKAVLSSICTRGTRDCVLGWISTLDGSFTDLASSKGSDFASAAVSNDDRLVAYTRAEGLRGSTELSLISARGGTPAVLRVDGSGCRVLGWTQDSAGVVLLEHKDGARRLSLVRVTDGRAEGAPLLLKDLPDGFSSSVSRNGTFLYSVRRPLRTDVFVAPLADGAVEVRGEGRRVSDIRSTMHTSPAWSSDGRELAWVTTLAAPTGSGMPKSVLSVSSLQSGSHRDYSLQVSLGEYKNLTWTPDGGSVIAKNWDSRRRHGLQRIDVATGEVAEILSPEAFQGVLATGRVPAALGAWTRDGKAVFKLLIVSDASGRPRLTSIVERSTVDGGEREIWTDEAGLESSSLYTPLSPDGKWLALRLDRHAPNDELERVSALVLIPTAGGPPRELRDSGPAAINFCAWRPDNLGLVCTVFGTKDAPSAAFYYPLDGGSPRNIGLVVPANTQTFRATFQEIAVSPDGKQIAYTVGAPGRDEGVWTMENFLPSPKIPPVAPATSKK